MKNTNWRDVIELVGIGAIVASLIFVGLQLQQEQKIALAEYGQSTSTIRSEFDFALAEHAAILVKSNSGEELSLTERAILSSMVRAYWRGTIIDTAERRRLGGDDGKFAIHVFSDFLYQNPGAREIWYENVEITNRNMEALSAANDWILDIENDVVDSLNTLDSAAGNQ